MSKESNYTDKPFWGAEVCLDNNIIYICNITRVELKEYILKAPQSIKNLKDIDISNKYVVPYVYSLFEHYTNKIKYIIIKRRTKV